MAKKWLVVLATQATAWEISADLLAVFTMQVSAAEAALAKVQDKTTRNQVGVINCNEAFKAMTKQMRYIKRNYFNCPPRTVSELGTLGLSPQNPSTDVPAPENQVTAKYRPLGEHLMELKFDIVGTFETDSQASDYGFRVYWGIMPVGGASVAAATGQKRELMTVPSSGADLPFSRFTRKKREVFDFDATDRGKTVYFCLRLENAKGQAGPWGPLLNWMIP
jgi:hypothetical protein